MKYNICGVEMHSLKTSTRLIDDIVMKKQEILHYKKACKSITNIKHCHAVNLCPNTYLPVALPSCLLSAVQELHKGACFQPFCHSFQWATREPRRHYFINLSNQIRIPKYMDQTKLTARAASSADLKATNPDPLLTPFESRITYNIVPVSNLN